MQFIVGFVMGIVVSAVGFTTVAQVLDQGVTQIKETATTVVNK